MFVKLPHRTALAVILSGATVTAAGAATFHRYIVTQTAGSGGATNFLQTTASGSGLQGEVGSTADTGYNTPFGVFGVYDAPGTTFGIGVLGASTTGYGIAGESLSDTQPSILAYPGGNGIGLQATTLSTSNQPSIYGEAKGSGNAVTAIADKSGYGLLAKSATGTAIVATTPGSGGVGYLGSANGEGVVAYGYSGNAANPAARIVQSAPSTDYLGTYTGNGTQTMVVQAGTAQRSGAALINGSDVQISGDLYVYGKIYQDCAGFPAVSTTGCYNVPLSASRTTSAVGRSPLDRSAGRDGAARSIDRIGTTRLLGGRAFVRLDRDDAAQLAGSKPYLAFVTPLGDCRGLYVTNRTPLGFEVRELGGGRTTVDFEYRVVADAVESVGPQPAKQGYIAAVNRNVPAELARIAAERAHPQRETIARPFMPTSLGHR